MSLRLGQGADQGASILPLSLCDGNGGGWRLRWPEGRIARESNRCVSQPAFVPQSLREHADHQWRSAPQRHQRNQQTIVAKWSQSKCTVTWIGIKLLRLVDPRASLPAVCPEDGTLTSCRLLTDTLISTQARSCLSVRHRLGRGSGWGWRWRERLGITMGSLVAIATSGTSCPRVHSHLVSPFPPQPELSKVPAHSFPDERMNAAAASSISHFCRPLP